MAHGYRLEDYRDDGDLLVIDDTVCSGRSFTELTPVLAEIGREHPVIRAAVYSTGDICLDLVGKTLQRPHYLEWNFFNSIYAQDLAIDWDGILCPDCPVDKDDDGDRYLRWIRHSPRLHRPVRYPLRMIATARLEKWRGECERRLAKDRIACEQLVMGPWSTIAERSENWDPGELKGKPFRDSTAKIFVESCRVQAKAIAEVSGKRVICPGSREVFN
jgi:uncharacterized HAD superfamily protein